MIIRVSTVNPAENRTLHRGSDRFGAGRLRVYNLMHSNVDLDRTYEIPQRRGSPEYELSNVLRKVLSGEYGYQANMGALPATVPPALVTLFNNQRARATARYNSLKAANASAMAKNIAALKKANAPLYKRLRVTDPGWNSVAAVNRQIQIFRSLYPAGLKVWPALRLTSIPQNQRSQYTYVPGDIYFAYPGVAALETNSVYLKDLDYYYLPVPVSQMESEIVAGKFKTYQSSCGKQYVFTASEQSRTLSKQGNEIFQALYDIKCPGKSFGEQLKEVAIRGAIFAGAAYAASALLPAATATGAGASAATAIPAGAAAAPASAAPVLTSWAAPAAAAPAVASSLAPAAGAAASAVPLITKVADTASAAVPLALQVKGAADAMTAKPEPLVIPIDKAEGTAPATGGWLIPALIGGGLLLLSMKG